MLDKVWRSKWRILALAAIWLVFECYISWAAFCDPENYGGRYQPTEEYNCVFGGPVVSIVRAFIRLWRHVFHDADAYVALFTAILSGFTLALWRSTDKLWAAGERQIRLARDEFLSIHRPRMRLKHAWFTDQTAWRLDGPLEITLDFVNIGGSEAHITWVNYQSLLLPRGEPLPQRPPYDDVPPSGLRITRFQTIATLPSGITLPRQVCDGILNQQEVHDILWGTRILYLIGTIEYWDSVRRLRQTAFCRRLTYETYPPSTGDMGRFKIKRDPDYEYED